MPLALPPLAVISFTTACAPASSTSTTAALAPSRKACSRLSTWRPDRRRIFAWWIAVRS
jgi:hypothetical protein